VVAALRCCGDTDGNCGRYAVGILQTSEDKTIMNNNEKTWHIYILQCSDGSLYCGITTSLERRLHEHNNTKKGAKYTRSRRPTKIVWTCQAKNRSEASKEEARIKRLSRNEKINMINKYTQNAK
jgi:putative endonuclease